MNAKGTETEKRKSAYAGPKAVKRNAGRPNCLDEDKLAMLLEAYYSRPYSFRELADIFGVSRMTVWRAVQETPASGGRLMG